MEQTFLEQMKMIKSNSPVTKPLTNCSKKW